MSRPVSRISFLPALLCGLAACGAALGFGGCTSGAGGLADADAVESAAALSGDPLPIHGWTTDLAAARRTAAAEGKDVLMLFTGSDWCPACVEMEQKVFAKAPASRMEDEFVPVLVDFPNRTPQAASLAARNEALQAAYGVSGFPTVLLTAPDGAVYGKLHYAPSRYATGGAAAFIADAQALRSRQGGGGMAKADQNDDAPAARTAAAETTDAL